MQSILYLTVTVTPKSSKNEVVSFINNTLKVKVTAAPEKGRANNAVIELLADYFAIKKSQITLCSGATSRNKRFQIIGITLQEIQKKVPL